MKDDQSKNQAAGKEEKGKPEPQVLRPEGIESKEKVHK